MNDHLEWKFSKIAEPFRMFTILKILEWLAIWILEHIRKPVIIKYFLEYLRLLWSIWTTQIFYNI